MSSLSHGLCGTAGEFYVAAELSRRGFLATITNRNAESVDILAARPNSGRALKVQVKTSQHSKTKWVLSKKDEADRGTGYFYIFVSLHAESVRPDFFIVPGKVVAGIVKNGHAWWLTQTTKKGEAHKDTPMRNFGGQEAEPYKEKWALLDEASKASES
jgi:hypothetical protein